ncbi:HoxN/HupN/NixA family nickel/cobalt transporter [Paraburkholderia heleia]|uniref:HoxN/HupN/NixA family nickel/cobalt transporter n=1 Tax=Paraburkholderia heleia TaxID=634127 RepID=UPI0031CF55AD
MSFATEPRHPRASSRSRIVAMYATLALVNILAWTWALIVLRTSPMLLGTAFLAYSFGLRHAMDADHIAAIDNVTRKLMNDGKRPVTVGFYFALGHSLTVVVGALVVALATRSLAHHFETLRETGATIGTLVSAVFLLAIAALNVVLLIDLVRAFRKARRGEIGDAHNDDAAPLAGNLIARMFRPLFGLVRSSWLMLPLGVLFGLGFETATEVALLGTSASQASAGFSIWTILAFPCLFAAGMLTVDTTDGILMLGAYGWAFIKPLRKLYYNLTITLLSTLVAALIGGIEALGLAAQMLALSGPFWRFVDALNSNFGLLGYGIVAIFTIGWLASAMLYKLKDYEKGASPA